MSRMSLIFLFRGTHRCMNKRRGFKRKISQLFTIVPTSPFVAEENVPALIAAR